VWGQSGTAVKDQGSHDLALEFGAQRACFIAWVLWDQKDSNPIITLLYSTLLLLHSNNGCINAPHCYSIYTLPLLLSFLNDCLLNMWIFECT